MISHGGKLYHERLRTDGHWAANGLVGLWYMNAMTGSVVADLSPYRNHGVMTNMDPASDWVAGDVGSALRITAVWGEVAGQHITVNSPSLRTLGGAVPFTFHGRIKPTAVTDKTTLFGCGSPRLSRLRYNLQWGNTLELATHNGYWHAVAVAATRTLNKWGTVTLTWDGISTVAFYVDGMALGTQAFDTAYFPTPLENFNIGNNYASYMSANFYSEDHDIDYWFAYNRAFTPVEVAALSANPYLPLEEYRGLPVWLFGEEGGAALSVTLTDSGVGSDTITALYGTTVALTDAGVGSDALAATYSAAVALADAGAGADALSAVFAAVVALADAGACADALGVAYAATVALQDAGVGADTIGALLGAVVNLADAATGADSLAAALGALVALSDSGVGADVIEAALWQFVNLSDAGAARDTLAATYAAIVALSDSSTGDDALVAIYAAIVALQDAGIGADTITALMEALVRYPAVQRALAGRIGPRIIGG